ncbi:MAG: hypothetical protein ACI81Q_001289 [Paracoccaceae bacterium]|jgi:hypothetical protein
MQLPDAIADVQLGTEGYAWIASGSFCADTGCDRKRVMIAADKSRACLKPKHMIDLLWQFLTLHDTLSTFRRKVVVGPLDDTSPKVIFAGLVNLDGDEISDL